MRIDSNAFATIGSLQDNSPAHRPTSAHNSSEQADGVTAKLSSDSKTLSSITSESDIRHDRVAALKQAIDSGTYEINAQGIAAAMMDNMLTVRFTL